MRGLGKYTIPIIGVLSSGKSTFINGLFLNNSILEVGMGHTTKFICIIRHQHELESGKYRFTKVKINSDSLIKDGDTIEDEIAIKNKIIEINKKEVVSEEILNNFYLLELNIHLIDDTKLNDELLKDIDFLDIPGLDFFEAKKNSQNEIESKKITNIFKNFKEKLKYFIIIFDCLCLHHDTAFSILEKIKNEFNIELKNNLIVINKINLMPEKTAEEIKEYFIQELLKKPDIINHNKNTILLLNAEKIILQQQYKKRFDLFIKYLYYLFCEFTLEKRTTEENIKNSFLDYIIDFIDKKKEELNIGDIDANNITNYEEVIKPAFEQIYTNAYHSEQIKYIQEETKEDFFNDLNKDLFLELYYLYLNNFIKYDLNEYNEAKKEITNYLKMICNNKEDIKIKVDDNIKEKKNKNLSFIKKLDEFMKSNILTQYESGNNVNDNLNREFNKILKEMNQRKNLIVNAFLNHQFRISVVGLSSVGKSYFINCLIGKEILETGSGETTQFGLIIENHDSDEVSLWRAKYKYICDENGKEYLIFEKDKDSFVNGFDNVKNHLLLLNKNKIHQEKDNIEDKIDLFRFWILKIRISMCRFKNFNVQILDIPGLGTSIKYVETEIFKNLISTSNIIFHILDYNRLGEADKEISNNINKYINDYRLDPYFASKNTLYLLNKLNPLINEEINYEDKISEIFEYKKELIDFIEINNNFFDDVIKVTNFTFSSYLKTNYDNYQRRYKKRYQDFVKFFNAFNKNKILNIDNSKQIIKDKAIEEFQLFLSKEDKEEHEKIIFEHINNDENFKNNLLYFYTIEKINLDKNGTLEKIDKLNNIIIEKFGYTRDYFKKIIKDFILNINKLLQNILDSRSIPKDDLEGIKNQFKDEIESKYDELITMYSNNFESLKNNSKSKLESLRERGYKKYLGILGIDKTKIRADIQNFIQETADAYNRVNKEYFTLLIQNQLNESLKQIILNYEEKRNSNKKGKKMEFSEFKKFINENIHIIENDNIELVPVEPEECDCCYYTEEKKNAYLNDKFQSEEEKLQRYFNILKDKSINQRDTNIADYLMKLDSSFGDYNQEEKRNISLIKDDLNKIINELFNGISDYHSYVEQSFEKSERIFQKEIKRFINVPPPHMEKNEEIKEIKKNEIKENKEIEKNDEMKIPLADGFGFKKMDISIYPGKNIYLTGISIKIYKEIFPELSTPFITIDFPPKNINLIDKVTSCLIDFEKFMGDKIFVIANEKSIERIRIKINFIKNFKYFNWIQMFSDVLNKFSLFKFEFLTSILINQPLDSKAFTDLLKSFLLIQIQGDIPIRTIFEFLRAEKILTQIEEKLIPDNYRILFKALTSITFTLNTSIDKIPYEFVKFGDEIKTSFEELIAEYLGIPKTLIIECEDVEINFRLLRNNLKILLHLPAQDRNKAMNLNDIGCHKMKDYDSEEEYEEDENLLAPDDDEERDI